MQPEQGVKYKELNAKTAQALWDSGCSIEWKLGNNAVWNLCKYDGVLKVDWDHWYSARLVDRDNPRMRIAVE